jgi:hypothetical protein
MHGVYKERIPDELIERFKAARIPYVATSFVFDAYADLAEGQRETTALERETVPADVLAGLSAAPKEAFPPELVEYTRMLTATREARCDNIRRLNAAGVRILAGADAQLGVFPGSSLHREIAGLMRCGLTPFQALQAATSAAARFVSGQDEPEFGILVEGRRADLLMVNGNPLAEPEALHWIALVIKDGRVLQRRPLAEAGATARPAES